MLGLPAFRLWPVSNTSNSHSISFSILRSCSSSCRLRSCRLRSCQTAHSSRKDCARQGLSHCKVAEANSRYARRVQCPSSSRYKSACQGRKSQSLLSSAPTCPLPLLASLTACPAVPMPGSHPACHGRLLTPGSHPLGRSLNGLTCRETAQAAAQAKRVAGMPSPPLSTMLLVVSP